MMSPILTTHSLILASGSPRRIEILRGASLDPVVCPSSYQETVPFPMAPADRAMFFAMGKALDIREELNDKDAIIVGADTIVVYQNSIMEKPRDKADGMQMLMALSGQTHQVITGVCIADQSGRLTRCFYESSDVTFCSYSEEEMDAYLDTDEAYDKAGGYGIQGTFRRYVSDVHGDIDNIIGFPLTRFLEESQLYETILKNGRL